METPDGGSERDNSVGKAVAARRTRSFMPWKARKVGPFMQVIKVAPVARIEGQ